MIICFWLSDGHCNSSGTVERFYGFAAVAVIILIRRADMLLLRSAVGALLYCKFHVLCRGAAAYTVYVTMSTGHVHRTRAASLFKATIMPLLAGSDAWRRRRRQAAGRSSGRTEWRPPRRAHIQCSERTVSIAGRRCARYFPLEWPRSAGGIARPRLRRNPPLAIRLTVSSLCILPRCPTTRLFCGPFSADRRDRVVTYHEMQKDLGDLWVLTWSATLSCSVA